MSRATPHSVAAASAAIAPVIRRTPVLRVPGSELGIRPSVTFKLEHLQHSGTFKARGAANVVATTAVPDAGLVAASGGNHGAAVAWAAAAAGYKATIFVPTISSAAKVARLHQYGADVHQVGSVYAEALAASVEHQAESGALAIHAYDDPIVMSGAGTLAREFVEQAPDLDAMIVACGGGGLAGGAATWLDGSMPLVVCETEGTQAFSAAQQAGAPVPVEVSGIAADSLGAPQLGSNPWAALQGCVPAVVTDDETIAARTLLWDNYRMAVEPAAAVPVAALLSGRVDLDGLDHVGVVICGANVAISF